MDLILKADSLKIIQRMMDFDEEYELTERLIELIEMNLVYFKKFIEKLAS